MGIADPSKRLEAMPPYMFQELERQIADKRAAGIDVISLGIGDPDQPTYDYVVEAMQEAVADPATHQYPSNRGREEFRQAFADFYDRRFGVEIDPETEVIPAIGAKECIYNLCFAFLDPGDVALASDPGYPVYTGGPILADATPELLPLVPELGFAPDLGAIPADVAAKARLMFINYPNNPTGAVVPEGFFEMVVSFAKRARDPRRPRQRLLGDDLRRLRRAQLPRHARRQGGRGRGLLALQGLQHDRLALRRDPRQRRGDPDLLAAEDQRRLRPLRGRADRRRRRPDRARSGPLERMNETYTRRRDLVVAALREIGVEVAAPKGTIYVWAPVPEGHTSTSFCETVLEEAAVVISPGSMYGPSGEGFFRISLTTPDDRIEEAVERMREHLA